MKRSSLWLTWTYSAMSLLGLLVVGYFVVRLLTSTDPSDDVGFLQALFGNWTSTIVIVDLLIAAAATIVWAISEAKRLGMRWILWLLLMATMPFAFVLPLFLAMRERRRANLASVASAS
jgi:uncharacterized protein DUF2834